MKKINYALLGIVIAAIVYGVLYSSIPKVLVPDIDKNTRYLDSLEVDSYVDLSNVVTMIGYQLYSQDIDNRIASNIFAYGRSNPMYFIKVNVPRLEKEHKEAYDSNNNSGSDKINTNNVRKNRYYVYPYSGGESYYSNLSKQNLSTYMTDYNSQFSMVSKNNILGYNKVNSEMEVVDLGNLLAKIRRDLKVPLDSKYLTISSKFGARVDPFTYENIGSKEEENIKNIPFHTGLDFSDAGINGANVYSMLDGTVKRISKGDSGYGNLVVVEHGGFETYYAHLSSIRPDLEEGNFIMAGETLGQVGSTGRSTGPHLHIEFNFGSVSVNPELFISPSVFKFSDNDNLNPSIVMKKKLEFKNKEEEKEEARVNEKGNETIENEAVKPSPKVNKNKVKNTYKPKRKWKPAPTNKSTITEKDSKLDKLPEEKMESKVDKLEPLPDIDLKLGE